jgi:hypothetical protein
MIMITGNYTFFNMLTITLCVPLLDDDVINFIVRVKWIDLERYQYTKWFMR